MQRSAGFAMIEASHLRSARARGHQHLSLARKDDNIADPAGAIEGDPLFVPHHFRDRTSDIDLIAGAYRRAKLQRLAEINRAVAGKLLSDHRRNQARRQDSMRNASFEDRTFGVFFIEVDGIAVSAGNGKRFDFSIGDNTGKPAHHAGFNIFNEQRAHKWSSKCVIKLRGIPFRDRLFRLLGNEQHFLHRSKIGYVQVNKHKNVSFDGLHLEVNSLS